MVLLLHTNVARSICVNTSSEAACVAEGERPLHAQMRRNAPEGETGERWGARIQNPNIHPFSHLVLREATAAVSPKPGSRMGF